MEPDPRIICSPHLHVARSNPSAALKPRPWFENFAADASMDKYRKQQQQQHDSDLKRKSSADESRRTKLRREKETTDSTFSSLQKHPQLNGEGGGRSSSRSHRTGFDPLTDDKQHKISVRSPNLSRGRPVNGKKVVNWRLACFMSNEYLTRGTLLGKPWPPQDSNPKCCHENNDKSEPKSASLGDESRREQEKLYHTLADFLRAGDVHLPGIVNPSQLAAWLDLKK